ncbi:hypothetical protein EDD86DRAFT_203740 [Gorgonomyces haynaldii]|nr:hypothetical protein EDD86DRAFT_203740 [Gorgonomyces haynaldii]
MDKMLDTTFKNFGLYSDVFEYPKYKDILMIDNKEAMEKMLAEMHEIVKEAEGYDHSKFSEQDKQDFLLMKDLVQQIALGHSCWGVEIPMTHFSVSDIPRTLAHYQQINNAQDYENYKKRLGQFKQMIEGYIQGFKLGLEAGITLPVESVDLMIVSCGKLISTELEKSPFLCGGKIKKAGLDPQPAMDIIKDSVLPVYEQLKTFLEQEYLPKARKTPGIYGLKDAERIYGDMIYLSTSVRYEPKELHQLGLEEVERIAKRMEETKSKVFEGTLAEFRTALKEGKFPEYKLKEPKDAVDYYKNLVKEIGEIMPKYFNKFPKFECNIQAVEEAAEDSSPLAFYMVGTSQTPGVFMTNLKLAGSKGMQQAMALTLHEAIPGHHHQVSLEFEDENSHTLKKLASCTSYAEGWGLYAEYLGEEMGMYKDGISLYGRLELEMHRALRLVVDTGLHAMGWSFDKCVDLMRQHLTLTEEEILSEVKRYSIMPGQALAYKVGEIQIRKLRKEAEEALGSQFDIKAFHDVVLDHGSVTMETLAVNVREWIQQELKSRKEE